MENSNQKKLMYSEPNNKKIVSDAVFNFFLCLVIFVFILFGYFTTTHPYYGVIGSSMEPNILQASSDYVGDGCYVELTKNITYGDVVVANKNRQTDIVKRVLAMEGDQIGFYHNTEGFYEIILKKSGESEFTILNESYLFANISESEVSTIKAKNQTAYQKFINLPNLETTLFSGQTVNYLTIPDENIFLVGDNRATSTDCLTYGPIETSKVFGKVILVVENDNSHLFDVLKYYFT